MMKLKLYSSTWCSRYELLKWECDKLFQTILANCVQTIYPPISFLTQLSIINTNHVMSSLIFYKITNHIYLLSIFYIIITRCSNFPQIFSYNDIILLYTGFFVWCLVLEHLSNWKKKYWSIYPVDQHYRNAI